VDETTGPCVSSCAAASKAFIIDGLDSYPVIRDSALQKVESTNVGLFLLRGSGKGDWEMDLLSLRHAVR
jgi:hypothetical protein